MMTTVLGPNNRKDSFLLLKRGWVSKEFGAEQAF